MKNNNHKTDCSKQTRVVPMKFRVVPIAGLGVILEVHGKSRPDQEADREYFLPMDIDAAMSMGDMLRAGAIEASEKQATA